jgi:hypothetical protein
VTPTTWKVPLDEILEGRAAVTRPVDQNLEGSNTVPKKGRTNAFFREAEYAGDNELLE